MLKLLHDLEINLSMICSPWLTLHTKLNLLFCITHGFGPHLVVQHLSEVGGGEILMQLIGL